MTEPRRVTASLLLRSVLSLVGFDLVLGPALFLPAGDLVPVVRTALEDRTLRAEPEGYGEYARRVRHRLIPGVW